MQQTHTLDLPDTKASRRHMRKVRAIDDDELSANVNRKRWSPESEETRPLTKNEKREIYKEYGGRKPRSKGKLSNGVGGGGHRDRGGWDAYNGND